MLFHHIFDVKKNIYIDIYIYIYIYIYIMFIIIFSGIAYVN